jgi:glycosyltransferase involved in cell wall biosynthesis
MPATVVIPVHNEAPGLRALAGELARVSESLPEPLDVVWVDDGSTDGGAAVLRELGLGRVASHQTRLGYGAALKLGLRAARGESVVFMDADGQHDPREIPRLLEALEGCDLVVAERRGRLGWARRAALGALRRLASRLIGRDIPDLTSGLRAYRRERLLEVEHMFPNGFSASATGTLAFAVNGFRIVFLPVEQRPRAHGASKIRPLRDAARFFALILRVVFVFCPLQFFLPLSGVLFLLGTAWTAKTIAFTRQTSPLGMALFVAALLTLLFGLLADQVASLQRSVGRLMRELQRRPPAA